MATSHARSHLPLMVLRQARTPCHTCSHLTAHDPARLPHTLIHTSPHTSHTPIHTSLHRCSPSPPTLPFTPLINAQSHLPPHTHPHLPSHAHSHLASQVLAKSARLEEVGYRGYT